MAYRIKNIEFSTVLALDTLVEYQPGQVVSRTLAQNNAVGLTIFAFDKGEEISTHASGGDALVLLLDGTAAITIGGGVYQLEKGESIVMPANVPHSLFAKERSKILLTVIS